MPDARYLEVPRLLVRGPMPAPDRGRGTIAVLTAGTSDIPVAEEAAVTAELAGNKVERVFDVGVAGIHRLLAHRATVEAAEIVIVAAGMDGVLPTVVAGLFSRPVIAVPTSVGYGASFGGVAALLTMLNSCAAGVAVVNIDNGFGAGRLAAMLNRANARMKALPKGLHLHFDPSSGIAGDMTVGGAGRRRRAARRSSSRPSTPWACPG